jgi:hypothetical protein
MSIDIETVEQLRDHHYTVTVWCTKCNCRGPELDLNQYIRQGRGGLRPIDLGLKHKSCGTVLQLSIHPAKGFGK